MYTKLGICIQNYCLQKVNFTQKYSITQLRQQKIYNKQKSSHKKMFDDLLEQFNQTIQQAKAVSNQLGQQLSVSMAQMGVTQHLDNHFSDPTHTLGKAVSFGKSQRFKQSEKQQPKTTDCFYDVIQNRKNLQNKGIKFNTTQRFTVDKIKDQVLINPNYDAVKKNNKQAPKIVKDSNTNLDKSRLSIVTAASDSEVGPGRYFINQQLIVKPQRNGAFSKNKRFAEEKKKYQGIPLYPRQTLTKKRPPTAAVLKKKITKNTKLITKQQQQGLRQRLKMIYWQTIPLQLDRLLKKHINAPLIREKYFSLKKLSGTQKRCAILMLLDRMNLQRGGLDKYIAKDIGTDVAGGIVYRKSTPKPFKFSEMEPGPDYYYPQDDLIKPNLQGYTFGKQKAKLPQPDNRDYEINEQPLKHGGNIIINPQHKPHQLTEEELISLNRGPGFYDCLFKQVQKRDDIGIVKFQPVNEQNARQNNCVERKEVNDGVYFPSYNAIDPSIPAPLYKQPANIKPIHLPDKEMFPEHWLFYDGDLNKVRAQIAKNVLIAQGMNFKQYSGYKKKFQAFKNYLQDRRKLPEALQYNVQFKQIDAHLQGFDMEKKSEKTLIQPIKKDEFGVDGDNLLLSPEKQKKKLPDINFKKMVGRQEQQLGADDVKQGDVLLINPKKPQNHIAQIIFDKMVDRPELITDKNPDREPAEGDVVIVNPIAAQRKLANIDFSKQSNRPQIKTQVDEDDLSQNILHLAQKPVKKVKGLVELQRMTSTRLVPILRKKKLQQLKKIAQNENNREDQQNSC